MAKGLEKFIDMFRIKDDYDDYDEYDEYDDGYEDEEDYDDIPAPVVKKKIFKKETTEPKKETKTFIKKTDKKENMIKPIKSVSERHSESKNKIVPLKSSPERSISPATPP